MASMYRVGSHKTYIRTKGKTTHVRYHNTDVVSFSPKQIKLNTGGWKTATTKTRMNQTSNQYNLGFTVFQKKGNWFVKHKNKVKQFKGNTLTLRR